MKLVIVIPVFNEKDLLPELWRRLVETPPPVNAGGRPLDRRFVLIDDGSTDGSGQIVRDLASEHESASCCIHARNQGKGAALSTGFTKALELGADVVLVQDADLEYDPRDHARVLAPILDGRADAVIGSRFLGESHRVLYFWHYVANRFITLVSNVLTNLNLTDIECCSKAMTREVLERIRVREPRFGVEPELVARLARLQLQGEGGARSVRIFEVPVSYAGRTYAEGKKITWRDGLSALRCIVQYNLLT